MHQKKYDKSTRPYAALGAGQLTSNLWKTGDERSGWSYRFNIYRISSQNGHVTQIFRPSDVPNLVKLCQVLAVTLADDGCIPADLCHDLADLSLKLDAISNKRR